MPSGWKKNAVTGFSRKEAAGGGRPAERWSYNTAPAVKKSIVRQQHPDIAGAEDGSGDWKMAETKAKKRGKRRAAKIRTLPSPSTVRYAVVDGVPPLDARSDLLLVTKTDSEEVEIYDGQDGTLVAATPLVWPRAAITAGATFRAGAHVFHDPTNAEAARRYDSYFSTKGRLLIVHCSATVAVKVQFKRCKDAGAIGCIFIESPTSKGLTPAAFDGANTAGMVAVSIRAADAAMVDAVAALADSEDHYMSIGFVQPAPTPSQRPKRAHSPEGDEEIAADAAGNDSGAVVGGADNPSMPVAFGSRAPSPAKVWASGGPSFAAMVANKANPTAAAAIAQPPMSPELTGADSSADADADHHLWVEVQDMETVVEGVDIDDPLLDWVAVDSVALELGGFELLDRADGVETH